MHFDWTWGERVGVFHCLFEEVYAVRARAASLCSDSSSLQSEN